MWRHHTVYNLDNLALQYIRWKNHHYLTPLVCSTIICNSYKLQNSVKCRSLFPPYYIFPVAAAQRRSHYVTLATASVAPPCDNSLGIYTVYIIHSVYHTQCANFNSLDIYTVCKQFMLLHNTCDKGSPYTNSDNCNPLCRNLVQCKLIQCHAIKFNVYLLWVWFRARASIGLLVTMWSMTYWGWASFVSDITKVIRHAVCLVGVLCFWHKSHLTRTKQFQRIIFWLICAQL